MEPQSAGSPDCTWGAVQPAVGFRMLDVVAFVRASPCALNWLYIQWQSMDQILC